MQTIELKSPIRNANGRVYDPKTFENAFKEYKKNCGNEMFGGLDHPQNNNTLPINKLSDIAVKIDDIKIDKKFETEWLDAKVEFLDTPRGQIAQQLHVNGVPMMIEPNMIQNPETGELQILNFDFVIDHEAAKRNEILNFIKKFQNEGTIETFTQGCCYWFARILCERFDMELYNTMIMYNNIDGHFAAKINGRLYDITGELNESSDWKTWDEFRENEPVYAKTVIRDCIKKL